MGELAALPNIGPVLESQLISVGITTITDLRTFGSKNAWLKIRAIDDSACIHRLLALEGAVRGIRKSDLPVDVRTDLRQFYQEFSGRHKTKSPQHQ